MKDIKIDEDKDSDDEESNSDVDDKETKSKKIAKEKKEKAKQDKKDGSSLKSFTGQVFKICQIRFFFSVSLALLKAS